ncbi:STAS domain-containing protein [Solimonas soli]|uniref:STAS domain-containing protein n=1 Tax=Solimonas soli TaxID=413479 RepID=UPI0004BA6BC3|nr:STAS domain-containing protein [Solimonas soli]
MNQAPDAPSGPLTFATAAEWFARAEALAARDTIDLSAVTQCDSAGVALLLELRRAAQRKGRGLQFVNAPAQLRGLVAFFGLDAILGLGTGAA